MGQASLGLHRRAGAAVHRKRRENRGHAVCPALPHCCLRAREAALTLPWAGGRRRRSEKGVGTVCLPQWGAPHLASSQKSSGKAQPKPGGGGRGWTSLARMLLSFLTGYPSFPQHIKHASPRPMPSPALLPPQCHQSGSEPLQAANTLHPALLLPRLVPTAASPQDPSNPAAAGPWEHLEGS